MVTPLVPLQGLTDPATLSLLLVVAGLGLTLAEALAPGAHFIVVGVALLLAGIIGLLFPPFASPLIAAGLVLAFGAAALWVYREFDFYGGKGSGQTSDSDSLNGKTGRVTERVTETGGEIKLDSGGFNPYYSARSVHGEIEEGDEVMVVDPGGGNVVTVESISGIETDEIDRELARGRSSDEQTDAETETERA